MVKLLTTRQEFSALEDYEKYVLLNKTETEVQKLQRLMNGVLLWREGTQFYNEAVKEYKEYLGVK